VTHVSKRANHSFGVTGVRRLWLPRRQHWGVGRREPDLSNPVRPTHESRPASRRRAPRWSRSREYPRGSPYRKLSYTTAYNSESEGQRSSARSSEFDSCGRSSLRGWISTLGLNFQKDTYASILEIAHGNPLVTYRNSTERSGD